LWPSFSNGYGRIPQSRTKEGSATHQKAKQKKAWVDVAASLMNGLVVSASAIITSGVPLEWAIKNVADLNGDSKADIVYHNTTTGDVAASLMNGLTVSESGLIAGSVPLSWEIQP
jgi:hypothetical protein